MSYRKAGAAALGAGLLAAVSYGVATIAVAGDKATFTENATQAQVIDTKSRAGAGGPAFAEIAPLATRSLDLTRKGAPAAGQILPSQDEKSPAVKQ